MSVQISDAPDILRRPWHPYTREPAPSPARSKSSGRSGRCSRCARSSSGAPRDTLAARLRTLVAGGILERRQYSEHPARYEYRLTEAGRELYPVIMVLMNWGDRHLAGPEGPPRVFEHHCGHRLVTQLVCEACGEPVKARDTRPVAAA